MPTSTAGNKPAPRLACAGFTLLELLFVLVIVGLGGMLAVDNAARLATRGGETSLVDTVVREFKHARVKAILSGMPKQLELSYEAGTLTSTEPNRPPVQLPARYAFEPPAGTTPPSAQSITFFPDGSATQAVFRLNTPSDGGYEIRINGLTGHVGARAIGRG